MEGVAICRMCGEKVSFKEGNIFPLGEHLMKNHPELQMTHYMCEDSGDGLHKSRSRKLSRRLSSSASSLFKKSSTLLKGKKKKKSKPTKRSMYKTTVESWRPGSAPITCPKCANTGQPYVRKQRNKVAYNSLGAFFLLGCWPLCFLPMMCGSTTTTVCCRKCGYCFGNYDHKKGKLIPASPATKNNNSASNQPVQEAPMEKVERNGRSQQSPVAKIEQSVCYC